MEENRSLQCAHGNLETRNIFLGSTVLGSPRITVIDWQYCGLYYEWYDYATFSIFNYLEASDEKYLIEYAEIITLNERDWHYFCMLKCAARLLIALRFIRHLSAHNYHFPIILPQMNYSYYARLWATDNNWITSSHNIYMFALSQLQMYLRDIVAI